MLDAEGEVTVIIHGPIMEIRLNRPNKKNAITAGMYAALSTGIAEAASRPDVRVLLLSGSGDDFCSGNDLNEFISAGKGEEALEFISTLIGFEKPIVAAVQGLAVGIGTTMLFHCDLIYAEPETRFLMPFVDLGLVPEAASTLLASSMLGHAKAAAMLLLGEALDAASAEKSGFISGIVSRSALPEHAWQKALSLAAKPPEALAHTRRLLRHDAARMNEHAYEEARIFRELLETAATRRAISSFFSARKRPSV